MNKWTTLGACTVFSNKGSKWSNAWQLNNRWGCTCECQSGVSGLAATAHVCTYLFCRLWIQLKSGAYLCEEKQSTPCALIVYSITSQRSMAPEKFALVINSGTNDPVNDLAGLRVKAVCWHKTTIHWTLLYSLVWGHKFIHKYVLTWSMSVSPLRGFVIFFAMFDLWCRSWRLTCIKEWNRKIFERCCKSWNLSKQIPPMCLPHLTDDKMKDLLRQIGCFCPYSLTT